MFQFEHKLHKKESELTDIISFIFILNVTGVSEILI